MRLQYDAERNRTAFFQAFLDHERIDSMVVPAMTLLLLALGELLVEQETTPLLEHRLHQLFGAHQLDRHGTQPMAGAFHQRPTYR